jgi:GNAT superfamily N-acetyltransferase
MELNQVQFGYGMTRSGLHQVTAHVGGHIVGGLQWHPEADPESGISRGEIETVAVDPAHQRKGIASGMLTHARSMASEAVPSPEHSPIRSPAGDAWANRTGGNVPTTAVGDRYGDERTRDMIRNMSRAYASAPSFS